jgi:hypothetical protein
MFGGKAGFTHKYYTRLENPGRDKYSSLSKHWEITAVKRFVTLGPGLKLAY